jgi:hypothetical protein
MKALLTLLALALFTHLKATAAPVAPQIEVDWPEFIGRHDLVWEEIPRVLRRFQPLREDANQPLGLRYEYRK